MKQFALTNALPNPAGYEKQDALVKLIAWFPSHCIEQLALTNALPNPAGS
jgi:hypothetical protein